jgi:hypothetical protein
MFKHLLKGFSVCRIGKKAIAFVSLVSATEAMKVCPILPYVRPFVGVRHLN